MSDTVLILDNVGKCYADYSSLAARIASWCGFKVTTRNQHWATRGVSFELKAGEAIALIGPNGAGKSTLLKLITGTIQPNEGGIASFARINSILELGLGFNPEFSGRENVRFAGGLMGLSGKRIEELMPDIEAFSELGPFFDQPLRVYSSGMQARLAFSVATAERPDLLIVDEVLSVGDSYFQHKSFERIRRYKEEGTSLLFVTHNMADVRTLCERVLLLEKGQVLKDGPADEVTDFYNARVAQREADDAAVLQKRDKDGWLTTKSGTGEATITKLSLLDAASGQVLEVARTGQELSLRAEVEVRTPIPRLVLGLQLRDRTGHVIWGTNSWHTGQVLHDLPAGRSITYEWRFRCVLGVGSYSVTPALTSSDTHLVNNYEWTDTALVFEVTNSDYPFFVGTTLLEGAFTIAQKGD
jgi:lipopolysaccharide transport system ATP-binding protein